MSDDLFETKRSYKVPPSVIAGELERIWSKNNNELKPPDVVNAARPKNAPLHSCFEWDNKVAAEKYRLVEARILIRSVRIIKPDTPSQPQFVHVRIEKTEPRAHFYQHVSMLKERPFEFLAALSQARRRLADAQSSVDELLSLSKSLTLSDDNISKLMAISEALTTARKVAEHLQ